MWLRGLAGLAGFLRATSACIDCFCGPEEKNVLARVRSRYRNPPNPANDPQTPQNLGKVVYAR
jgi:hypothetical protein